MISEIISLCSGTNTDCTHSWILGPENWSEKCMYSIQLSYLFSAATICAEESEMTMYNCPDKTNLYIKSPSCYYWPVSIPL